MPGKTPILEFDEPYFTVRLYDNMLKMDLKGTTKNRIEEALQSKPVLRQTLGTILGIFVPLHIRISDIDSVSMDEIGTVKIVLPRHRDINIPLARPRARKLVRMLNDLIPKEKRRELLRIMREQSLEKIAEERADAGHTGGATFPARASDVEVPVFTDEVAEAEEKDELRKED